MAQLTDTDIREQGRDRYAAAAKQASGGGCGKETEEFFGGSLHAVDQLHRRCAHSRRVRAGARH